MITLVAILRRGPARYITSLQWQEYSPVTAPWPTTPMLQWAMLLFLTLY